jgi:hypothetical protein
MLDLRAHQAEITQGAASRVRFRSEPPWKHRRPRVLLRTLIGVVLLVVGFYAGACWDRGRLERAVKAPVEATLEPRLSRREVPSGPSARIERRRSRAGTGIGAAQRRQCTRP